MTAIPQGGASLEFVLTSKWYGQISALTDVSARFTPGVTGLVGQNGAGKSTMMKLACGLLRPSFGEVFLNGEPPTSPRARQSLGYCSDIDKYYEHQSGFVFVAWMLRLSGASGRDPRSKAGSLLDELGLGDAMHRKIGGYSKGMRQRVKLAVALGHDPNVLLMDEPLTGLDLASRDRITRAISDELERGRTVVLTTHDLAEAAAADHVILMTGRVVAEGPPEEVLKPDRLSAAYGIGLVHLEDGTTVLDDATHDHRPRHIHFERSESRRD